ncbi:hypothetical protein [Sulfoacidibacillus ferrooxidans]|uniref:Uncharacterized protein n=1 Tax=Sulfoacidibacillus ferrooxidans TaxID=2005001 RepID=A0A9X2AFT6_9BACL|nr:hypothetical protein [Sulfoacidibacillus ferrooxidans]MCI0184797.1 hypothetical protein [Sulfoacidibacillus ferrooxidans]
MLGQEDTSFQPENWLWNTGLELIKNDEELVEFEEREYHIQGIYRILKLRGLSICRVIRSKRIEVHGFLNPCTSTT